MSKSKNSDKMTTAETSAWLVGQFQLCLLFAEAIKEGKDISDTLNQALLIIGNEARANDQITLLFATIEARQNLAELVK